jgi:hypothetical protein
MDRGARLPGYLTRALGRRSERGWGPERWRQGARAIEGYRERHGITDLQRALGPEPEDPRARSERRSIERTVEDVGAELRYIARAHQHRDSGRPELSYDRGPRHGLDQGIERGLDHRPSLGMGR